MEKIIEDLKIMDRTYFGKDRSKVTKAKIDEALAVLDTKPIDLGKKVWRQFDSAKQKAKSRAALLARQES